MWLTVCLLKFQPSFFSKINVISSLQLLLAEVNFISLFFYFLMETLTVFSRYWQHLFSWWSDSLLIYCDKIFLIHNVFLFPKLPQNSNLTHRHIDQIDPWLTLYLFYSSIFLKVSCNRLILFHAMEKETQITLKKHRAHTEMESLFYHREQASRSHRLVGHVKYSSLLSILFIWITPQLHLFPHHFLRENKKVSDDAFFIFVLPKEMTQ